MAAESEAIKSILKRSIVESKSKRGQKSGLFPAITSISDAQTVGRQGTWAACFVAGTTAIVALASIFGMLPKEFPINGWSLIDAALYAIIAWGIYQRSRIAALMGLIVYCLERIYMQITLGASFGAGIFVTLIIIFAFINSVRGTFAYHRMKQ